MSYTKIPISKAIEYINSGKLYLPAIQRKYVWNDQQIINLMDSIMRGYPIGTFLFWNVKKKIVNAKDYSMYRFIMDYHERDNFVNPPGPHPFTLSDEDENDFIWSLLDGQQRLTSIYISLQGSVSRKLPYKWKSNDDAYPKKELYFNLHSQIKEGNNDDNQYEFQFLTDEESQNKNEEKLWYRVKDILRYDFKELYPTLIIPNGWGSDTIAINNLFILHQKMVTDEIINYFEVKEDSIDNVLDIFVRVNSGGTVLSKTDLLFSTIVSHWDKARDEIDKLLEEINKKGEGFKFNNDFIMRTCLYVLDMSVSLKVETFKNKSVLQIKDNWNNIRKAIKDTVNLLKEFGFNSENITSYVAVVPIVYYCFNGGKLDKNSKQELKKYFISAQLRQIFGMASNSALTSIRNEQKKYISSSFSLSQLLNIRFTGDRTLKFSSEDIDSLFDTHEIGPYTFMILSLLYPDLKYDQKRFHQDHMHPHTSFEGDKLNGLVLPNGNTITPEQIKDWKRKRNTLANLQLLEEKENETKNDMPLDEWLKLPDVKGVKYLPDDISFSLSNFEKYLEKRQELMSTELKKILLG